MGDESNVTPEDALEVAQRALQKANENADRIDRIEERLDEGSETDIEELSHQIQKLQRLTETLRDSHVSLLNAFFKGSDFTPKEDDDE